MNKPTVLPIWDTNETLTVEPDASHKADGWLKPAGVPEKPPLETFNFWQNNVYKWQAYLEEITDGLLKLGRAQFAYVSTTQISIAGGGYLHHGTKSQVLTIDSTITHTITTPGTSQYHYIYLDDSAIVTAGTGVITGSEVINSTTAPTYSVTKKGWYNGDDLCIFAVWIESGGDVEGFTHSGESVIFWDNLGAGGSAMSNTTDVTFTLDVPTFVRRFELALYIQAGAGAGEVAWKAHEANSNYNYLCYIDGTTHQSSYEQFVQAMAIVDSGQQIYLYQTTGSTITGYPYVVGWYFPIGM
jgi:hypothetical protein